MCNAFSYAFTRKGRTKLKKIPTSFETVYFRIQSEGEGEGILSRMSITQVNYFSLDFQPNSKAYSPKLLAKSWSENRPRGFD